jgi:hypothetical protein
LSLIITERSGNITFPDFEERICIIQIDPVNILIVVIFKSAGKINSVQEGDLIKIIRCSLVIKIGRKFIFKNIVEFNIVIERRLQAWIS